MIGLVLSVLNETAKAYGTAKLRKYIDRALELNLEIQREEAKGYESDDAKIESKKKELALVLETARQDSILMQSAK